MELIKKVCPVCNKTFETRFKIQARCSVSCKNKNYSSNTWKEVTSCVAVGAIHELIVAADLMIRGCFVFRSVSASSPCDLIIIYKGQTYLVEVAASYKRKDRKIARVNKTSKHKFDVLACVYEKEISYFPDIFN